ncbi:ornithine cyclodeaminase family protein [Pyxidicoccus fallax]|uniref:Ornithine cyclodeaminase family protein n=1 Tax=Pyxidicoccus fallax TaxID=394095 RepID=A0A848LAX5_9BACT|nr:ornithine cyclodeaminase family protein [Pyxidicoccus fallax]NPC77707.1 ornithine cyclodeaminase family protein [Pyxidicoccus fallax]
MKTDATRTLLVTQADLRSIVEAVGLDALMDQLIHALSDALRGFDGSVTEVRKREGFMLDHPRQPGVLEWMPVMHRGHTVTVKMVGYSPLNPQEHTLPTIIATNSLYDVRTGHLLAIMDGVFATALRTGAASAVATRCLAAPGSTVLGLVGTGAQAVTQLHAISRLFPLKQVLAYDTHPEALQSFAGRVGFLGLDVRPVSLAQLEAQSDIICTATSVAVGAGPVISGHELKPHVHINAVGSDLPGKTELPRAFLERSLVVPDYLEQARVEGECQQLSPNKIGPDLVTLMKNPERYEAWRQRSTVFDSTGYALEDQVVTELLLEHAEQLGLGTPVALETIGGDALDPYSLLRGPTSSPAQAQPLELRRAARA